MRLYFFIIGTRRLFLKWNFKEPPIIKNCHNDYCTQEALNRYIYRVQTLVRGLRLKRHKCPHVESYPWPCAPLFSASNTPGFIFSAFPAPWSSSWVVEQLRDLEAVAFFVVWLCTRPTTWAPFIQTEASQGLDYSTSARSNEAFLVFGDETNSNSNSNPTLPYRSWYQLSSWRGGI